MATATITSKGQITIPKMVRDALHLHSGDKLEFIVSQDGEVLIRPVTKKVDDVFGRLHKPGRKAASIEEMDRAINKRIRAKYK
jgi:AbrB family looped-hinge helix DNA binding protein